MKYSTVQNWYPGDADGKGGIFNFVTKRALCSGARSKVSWTQVETGSAITWKYPSCILKGEGSVGEFYSVALTNHRQQADTGTKMIHIGKNSRSTIVSKGISAGRSNNTYRGLVRVLPGAENVRNFHPVRQPAARLRKRRPHRPLHRSQETPPRRSSMKRPLARSAKTSSSTPTSRGLDAEAAVALIVNGFAREVLKQLADGIRSGGAEAAGDLARRFGRMTERYDNGWRPEAPPLQGRGLGWGLFRRTTCNGSYDRAREMRRNPTRARKTLVAELVQWPTRRPQVPSPGGGRPVHRRLHVPIVQPRSSRSMATRMTRPRIGSATTCWRALGFSSCGSAIPT